MSIQPKLGYLSIWGSSFRLLFKHFGLLCWATLLVAAPFFIVNGLTSANQIMTFGNAALQGVMLPPEQVQMVKLLQATGDTLAFLGLTIAFVMASIYLTGKQTIGFGRHLLRELPRLLKSPRFWGLVIVMFIVFWMIEMSSAIPTLSGMALFPVVVFVMMNSMDGQSPGLFKRLQKANWIGWLALFFMLLITAPALFMLMNGALYMFLILPLVDLGGQQIMHLFEQGSIVLPYGIVTLSKFIALWLNLLLMAILLCTYLAVRGAPSGSRKK